MTGNGTGLDAQLMIAQETTWGTAVTTTRALEFNNESLNQDLTWVEGAGLHAGLTVARGSRAQISRRSVSGSAEFEIATVGMGALVKNMLGSNVNATTVITSPAYKQIHTPSGFRGLGLTMQIGRTEPSSGTVKPFTYAGCKCSKWDFNLKDNAIPTLALTLDGRSEDTAAALATAAYISGSSVFNFSQASLKLGGTATTTAGETTIASGVSVATIIKSFSLTGTNPMATDRYGIGNAGLKAEQLLNGLQTFTGKLDAEFNQAELYANYTAGTPTCLQFDLVGTVIGGSNNFLFSIILPMIKFQKATPSVSGPDIVSMSTDFKAFSDEVNPPIQIKIVSTEATTI